MSSIPKSKRKPSNLESMHLMYKIRKEITNEIILSFDMTKRKLDAHVSASTSYLKNGDENNTCKDLLREI